MVAVSRMPKQPTIMPIFIAMPSFSSMPSAMIMMAKLGMVLENGIGSAIEMAKIRVNIPTIRSPVFELI